MFLNNTKLFVCMLCLVIQSLPKPVMDNRNATGAWPYLLVHHNYCITLLFTYSTSIDIHHYYKKGNAEKKHRTEIFAPNILRHSINISRCRRNNYLECEKFCMPFLLPSKHYEHGVTVHSYKNPYMRYYSNGYPHTKIVFNLFYHAHRGGRGMGLPWHGNPTDLWPSRHVDRHSGGDLHTELYRTAWRRWLHSHGLQEVSIYVWEGNAGI